MTLLRTIGAVLVLSACGSSSDGGGAVDPGDGGAAGDGGPFTSAPFPAFPQFVYNNGPVVKTPKIKAITFAGDTDAAAVEAIVAKLAPSQYWADTMREYSVGAATAAAPVRLTLQAPATIAADGLEKLLDQEFAKTGGGAFGPLDVATIYTFFLPSGSTIEAAHSTSQGDLVCVGVYGFHWSYVNAATNKKVIYAVVGNCGSGNGGLTGLDAVAATVSHELAEAASDPYSDAHAWFGIDPDHVAWAFLFGHKNTGGEIGDICDFNASDFFKPAGYPNYVQRIWSDKAAKNGGFCKGATDPGPRRRAVPVLADDVTMTVAGKSYKTKGVKLAVGAETTIDVDVSSDVPVAPWTLVATATAGVGKPALTPPTLELTLDRTTVQNGDVAHLKIKLLALDPAYGCAPFAIGETVPGETGTGGFLGIVGPN